MIDRFDRVILAELQRDGRISFRELGARVNLSPNAVAERVRRMIAQDVIRGFHARVNLAALGFSMWAHIDIKVGPDAELEGVKMLIARIPEVRRALWITGEFDVTLEIACRDQQDLVRIIEFLRREGGIRETHTRMICMELDGAAQERGLSGA